MESNGLAEEKWVPDEDFHVLLLDIGGCGRGEPPWGLMVTPNGTLCCGWLVVCMVQRKAAGVLLI